MPDDQSVAGVPVHKARPISGLVTSAQVTNGRLRCIARYETTNGAPLCGVLLPIRQVDGRWRLVAPNGSDVLAPTPGDIVTPAAALRPSKGGDADRVEIDLPWPMDGIDEALVILLHEQEETIGDPGFGPPWTLAQLSEFLFDRASECGLSPEMRLVVANCLCVRPAGELDAGIVRRRRSANLGQGPLPVGVAAAAAAPVEPVAFALASCQYPAGLLDGSVRVRDAARQEVDLGPADHALWRLAKRCEIDPTIAAVLLTGDQVYVDATAGLFDPKTLLDAFGFAYDRLEGNRSLGRLLGDGIDVLPVMDDHEVRDNWDGFDDPSSPVGIEQAKAQYLDHQRVMWPPPAHQGGQPLWADRPLHGFDFFFADTRTERQRRTIANWQTAHIACEAQRQALLEWVARQTASSRPAFVVSPSMLLPRLLRMRESPTMALHADAWCGFPASLHALLAWIHDANAGRIVFLSGDEHLSSVACIEIRCEQSDGRVVTVHSVHSSALYAPFAFANARAEHFAAPETFTFEVADGQGAPRRFHCTVQVPCWCPGDGFAVLRPVEDGGRWWLDVDFDRVLRRPPAPVRVHSTSRRLTLG